MQYRLVLATFCLIVGFDPFDAAAQERADRLDALGDPLPKGALARLGTARLRHQQSHIDAAIFTPDGKNVVSGGWGGPCRLWDASTAKQRFEFASDSSHFCAVAVSPDSKLIAGACQNHVFLGEVSTGKTVGLLAKADEVVALGFSDAGKTLITACQDGSVHWWNVGEGKKTRSWRPWGKVSVPATDTRRTKGIWSGTVSSDGRFLVVQSASVAVTQGTGGAVAEDTIVVLDLVQGKELWRHKGQVNLPIFALAPDGRRMAFAAEPNVVEIREVATARQLAVVHFQHLGRALSPVSALAFSPDGNLLAIAGYELAGVAICALDDTTVLRRFALRVGDNVDMDVRCLAFSPNSKTLLVANQKVLHLYDAVTGQESVLKSGHRSPVQFATFSADNRHLFTGTAKSRLYAEEVLTWDTSTWQESQRSLSASLGKNLVSLSRDHSIYLARLDAGMWYVDRKSGKKLGQLRGHDLVPSICGGSFSACWRFFVGWVCSGQIQLQICFAVPTGEWLFQTSHDSPSDSAEWAFFPDGKSVALFGADGVLKVLDTANGKIRQTLSAPPAGLPLRGMRSTVALAPNGKTLATWDSITDEVRLWSPQTGRLIKQITPRRQPGDKLPLCLAWSPDSQMLAVGGGSGEIQLWETTSWRLRREWPSGTAVVRCLAFSNDGRLLASGNHDSTVLIWPVVM